MMPSRDVLASCQPDCTQLKHNVCCLEIKLTCVLLRFLFLTVVQEKSTSVTLDLRNVDILKALFSASVIQPLCMIRQF